jgi:hypothetical protein
MSHAQDQAAAELCTGVWGSKQQGEEEARDFHPNCSAAQHCWSTPSPACPGVCVVNTTSVHALLPCLRSCAQLTLLTTIVPALARAKLAALTGRY